MQTVRRPDRSHTGRRARGRRAVRRRRAPRADHIRSEPVAELRDLRADGAVADDPDRGPLERARRARRSPPTRAASARSAGSRYGSGSPCSRSAETDHPLGHHPRREAGHVGDLDVIVERPAQDVVGPGPPSATNSAPGRPRPYRRTRSTARPRRARGFQLIPRAPPPHRPPGARGRGCTAQSSG